jgi:hypothetical protein
MSMGQGPLMGGGNPLFGSGGFFGASPRSPYGSYGGCGCSSVFIILAGILLVFGGCLRMIGQ